MLRCVWGILLSGMIFQHNLIEILTNTTTAFAVQIAEAVEAILAAGTIFQITFT